MNLFVCFGKIMSSSSFLGSDFMNFASHVMGAHVSASLAFQMKGGRQLGETWSVFTINVNTGVFREFEIMPATGSSLKDSDIVRIFHHSHDFMKISVSAEEGDKILALCRACVRAKKRYNYHDVMLSNVPFRNPTDKTIFETNTLHDAQAVVLILRDCLDETNPLFAIIRPLNSRLITPSALFTTLEPYVSLGLVRALGDRQSRT